MIKRIIPILSCLILGFSVCVSAENTSGTTQDTSSVQQEMPQQGRGGGRMGGGMRQNNMGENAQGRDMQPPERPNDGNMPQSENNQQSENSNNTTADGVNDETSEATKTEGENMNQSQGQPPGGGFPGEMPEQEMTGKETPEQSKASGSVIDFIKEYQTPVISMVLLVLAFIFVKFYKRKMY